MDGERRTRPMPCHISTSNALRADMKKAKIDAYVAQVKKDKALAAYEETGGFPGEEDVRCSWLTSLYACVSVFSPAQSVPRTQAIRFFPRSIGFLITSSVVAQLSI